MGWHRSTTSNLAYHRHSLGERYHNNGVVLTTQRQPRRTTHRHELGQQQQQQQQNENTYNKAPKKFMRKK
jgi:hypothetical protein